MVDLSNKVGVTTDQLQRLQYGFELAGVAAEDTDQIMSQWAKRIGEANINGGKLAQIFKANNISLTDSNGHLRSSVELMRDFADLVQNAGSDQARSALSHEAFGKAGAQMVLALRDGKAGFDELMRAADDAGGVIDKQLLLRAGDLDDRFTALWHNFEINSKSAILTAVEALDDLNTRLTSLNLPGLASLYAKSVSMTMLGGNDIMQLWGTAQKVHDLLTDPAMAKSARLPDNSPIGQRINDAFDTTALNNTDTDDALVRALKDRYGQHTVIPNDAATRKASAAAAQEQFTAYEKVMRSLDDERAMLGLNETEQRVLTEQRKAGVTASSAEGQAIADTVRRLEKQKEAYEAAAQAQRESASLGKDVFSGLASDLRAGADAADIFNNAVGKIEDKLLDMYLNNLFMGADGKGNGPFGGMFSWLTGSLGGAIGGSSDPWSGLRTTSTAAVASAGAAPKSTINIVNNTGAKISHEETTDSAGNRQATFAIDEHVANAVAGRARRPARPWPPASARKAGRSEDRPRSLSQPAMKLMSERDIYSRLVA